MNLAQNKMYKTSIIIPVYNRPAQIIDCLNSLVKQSKLPDEIIVVDDGSTDHTASAVLEFKKKHPELKLELISNVQNQGITKSRNRGICTASGDYLALTDSDCTADPLWLEKICLALESSEATSGLVLDPEARTLAESAFFGGSMIAQHPLQGRLIIECNCAFRKEVLQNNKFDEALNYAGDGNDLAWRLENAGHKVSFAKDAVIYHHHPLATKELLKIAIKTGDGDSKYLYKRGLFIGRDVLFSALFLIFALLSLFIRAFFSLALACAVIQLALILACEIFFKRKTLRQALIGFPHNLLYNLVKALSSLQTTTRILLGFEPEIVQSKKEYFKK